jgi:hypothetical protein
MVQVVVVLVSISSFDGVSVRVFCYSFVLDRGECSIILSYTLYLEYYDSYLYYDGDV